MRPNHVRARLFASTALAVILALAVAGCKTVAETTGSISTASTTATPRNEAEWRRDLETAGEQYRKDPRNSEAAIRYAQGLRATGQRAQAAAVLEQASLQNPKNPALLGAYGRALADVGSFRQSLEVLNRAHTPDNPDWRILS